MARQQINAANMDGLYTASPTSTCSWAIHGATETSS